MNTYLVTWTEHHSYMIKAKDKKEAYALWKKRRTELAWEQTHKFTTNYDASVF